MSEPDKIQGIRPGRVVLVGGCFMDLVMRVERLPQAGEPVLGTSFGAFLGGKGFNQAVAARRAGRAHSLRRAPWLDPRPAGRSDARLRRC